MTHAVMNGLLQKLLHILIYLLLETADCLLQLRISLGFLDGGVPRHLPLDSPLLEVVLKYFTILIQSLRLQLGEHFQTGGISGKPPDEGTRSLMPGVGLPLEDSSALYLGRHVDEDVAREDTMQSIALASHK